MIYAKNISFCYSEGKQILQDLSFELEKGKTLAIVGASGCGKSTLLRIISGILPCTKSNQLQGTILVENQTPNQYRQTGKLAFMFQEATLMPNLTVKENIELPLKIKGSKDSQKVTQLMKVVGLDEFANYLPKQLSGGMKTRVALARAFVTNPELLLLDEPFSALDIGWKSDLYKRLIALSHTTVVIVTHDVQEAILLADKIIVLNRKGSIQANLSVQTDLSVENRVFDIARFVEDKAFKELYPILQQAIILEEERQDVNVEKLDKILNTVTQNTGDCSKEELIDSKLLDTIRDFANSENINKNLVTAFNKAKTDRLKYILLWDILEYDYLSDEAHKRYFDFYFDNINLFSNMSRQWYKTQTDIAFFQILKGRIETTTGFNKRKKWIYLCDMYASAETEKVFQYLEKLKNGENEFLNDPFAKEVAEQIQTKMKNEK